MLFLYLLRCNMQIMLTVDLLQSVNTKKLLVTHVYWNCNPYINWLVSKFSRSSYACASTGVIPPFLWSWVPETTPATPKLPWPRWHLACYFPKFNQPLGMWTHLGGRDNSGWQVVSPRQVTLVNRTTFLHINAFGSPTQDSSWRGKHHIMPRFRI